MVRLFLLAKKRLTEGSFFVDGDMVDNSTQTPRDDDSGKPEEEVTIEEDDATGAAPNNPEQADKEGKLILTFNFRSQKCFVIYNSSIFSNDFFESNLSSSRTTCLKLRNLTNLGVLLCWWGWFFFHACERVKDNEQYSNLVLSLFNRSLDV